VFPCLTLPSLCAHRHYPTQIYTGMPKYQTAYVLHLSVSKRHVPLIALPVSRSSCRPSSFPRASGSQYAPPLRHDTLQLLICDLAYQSPISTHACVLRLRRRRSGGVNSHEAYTYARFRACRADIGPLHQGNFSTSMKPVTLPAFRMRESIW
jgi:hypothetical protein